MLLVLVKASSFSKVIKMVQSTFNLNSSQKLEREDYSLLKFSSILLTMFFIINLAFLSYKINNLYKLILNDSSHLSQFLFFLAILFTAYLLKILVNELLGFVTNEHRLVSDYFTNVSLVNQTFGLFLFPWIILAQFSHFNPLVFVSGALIVLAISLAFRWYKGIIISLVEERIGILQIFIYFCGLEILPSLVVVKYIIETF